LPDGLEQQVGDRGQRLSRGQRQRIALARALVTQPKLLILDEATSALNPRDEDAVANNLKNLLPEMTLIIVAHKLGSLGLGRAVSISLRTATCGKSTRRMPCSYRPQSAQKQRREQVQ
jgi:ATP-binding cassette subfamily B protein